MLILLSDDDRSLAKLYRSWLEKHFSKKYALTILETDGSDALDIFRREKRIDLIISDINFLKAGIERVRIFKKEDPDVPIILASGRVDGHLIQELLDQKVIDVFLEKPIKEKKLISAVESLGIWS